MLGLLVFRVTDTHTHKITAVTLAAHARRALNILGIPSMLPSSSHIEGMLVVCSVT